ncbi:hypothetical protein ASE36_21610 [Rhizobium sp. Root274]|nr:hypothetical protein ASE36_21610 [Rhizobium sp. Root274]
MDLHNGEIIAFETARRPIFKLVKTMLETALATLDDQGRPMLHSDQGGSIRCPSGAACWTVAKMTASSCNSKG